MTPEPAAAPPTVFPPGFGGIALPPAVDASAGPGLTPEERAVTSHLVAAWHAFLALPVVHPSDSTDVRFHLNALQSIIAFRVARRVDPTDWY